MQYGVSNLLQHIPRNSDKLRERKSMLPKQKSNFPIISTDSGGWGEMGSRCFGLRIADSQKTGLECHIVVTSPSPPFPPPYPLLFPNVLNSHQNSKPPFNLLSTCPLRRYCNCISMFPFP